MNALHGNWSLEIVEMFMGRGPKVIELANERKRVRVVPVDQ